MFSTPDLKNKYQKKVFQGFESMKSFGNIDSFFGQIKTVTCHDDNSKVKEILGTSGKGKVLVINSNLVTHAAMIGDEIAQTAIDNEWSGVFIVGLVRDVELLKQMNLGILALGSTTTKTNKNNKGFLGEDVIFGGVILREGSWFYADKNGWLVSKDRLEID